jgi:hypothetical protein
MKKCGLCGSKNIVLLGGPINEEDVQYSCRNCGIRSSLESTKDNAKIAWDEMRDNFDAGTALLAAMPEGKEIDPACEIDNYFTDNDDYILIWLKDTTPEPMDAIAEFRVFAERARDGDDISHDDAVKMIRMADAVLATRGTVEDAS